MSLSAGTLLNSFIISNGDYLSAYHLQIIILIIPVPPISYSWLGFVLFYFVWDLRYNVKNIYVSSDTWMAQLVERPAWFWLRHNLRDVRLSPVSGLWAQQGVCFSLTPSPSAPPLAHTRTYSPTKINKSFKNIHIFHYKYYYFSAIWLLFMVPLISHHIAVFLLGDWQIHINFYIIH